MPKRQQPKKPKIDEIVEPKTQEKADLVPPSRRPPTAVGAETPPPLPPVPPIRSPQRRPTFGGAIETLRAAVGAMLDLADAAAEALTKALQRRA
jgi:hypothetical protein